MNDAPIYCRIPIDDYPCRMGLYVDEHRLSADGWVHPDLDELGRWTWPEGTL